MSIQRFDSALGLFVDRYMRNMHTNIRGTVVGVNYSIPSVDVAISAHTEFGDGTVDSYPTIFDVPVQLPSGSGGKSRLTMPIKVGDHVGLSFSERNENDSSDVTTHGLFPAFAVTQIFSDANAKPIHPDNVVLENDKAKIEMTPDGDITVTTPKGTFVIDKAGLLSFKNDTGTLTVKQDGEFSFGNGAATVVVTPGGQVNIGNANGGLTLFANGESKFNGGTITKDGNFITAQGVDLDAFWQDYIAHRHGGVQTGGGQTSTKV